MSKHINKILMYIDTMNLGGAQRVMGNLAEYFSGKGVEVVLVNDFVALPCVKQYELPPIVRRLYLREKLEGNRIIKNIERIINLRKFIIDENPDVILSFLGATNLRMLIATTGISQKKIVSVRNDPYKEYGTSFIRKFIAKQLFKLADGCVFQTEQASEYFTEDVRKKSKIIFNPVAEKFFEAQKIGDGRDIISVGRLAPQKNHKLLIEAFARIAAKYPNERLVIYGEGGLRNELENLVQNLNLQNRVSMPGEERDIINKLENCKLFVLTSDFEGMPNALMEAMTVGVPCVSTDCPCGGPKMLIDGGKNGLLVPVGNDKAIVAAMEKMLSDSGFRENIGLAAKESAEMFKPDIIFKQWEKYLEKVARE